MNTILHFVKLDYYAIKPFSISIFLAALVAGIIGIVSSQPAMAIMVLLTFSAFFMSICFAICEKSNLNKLYGILPIKRYQIVIGRYLFSLLLAVVSSAVAAILTLLVSLFFGIGVTAIAYSQFLSGSFFIFCLFIAIQFPFYFKFDYTKVAAVAVLPFVLVFAIGSPLLASLLKNPDFAKAFTKICNIFSTNMSIVWLTGIFAGLVLLGLSCLLSCMLYKNRELS